MTDVIDIAKSQIGVPYKLGSAAGRSLWDWGKQVYFDCSGLVAWTFYQSTGVKLPAFTDALAHDPRLTEVPTPNIGDIVLFRFHDSGQPNVDYPHAAIYAGNGTVVESGSADASRSAVNIMPLLTSLNPHFFRLKTDVIQNPPIVGPFLPNPLPIPGISTHSPAQAQTQVPAPPSGGTTAGSVGPWQIKMPTGLVIGLLGVLLLLIGALLFAFNLRIQQPTVTLKTPQYRVTI